MMQQLVASQGDGWTHALGAVGRFYEEIGEQSAPAVSGVGQAGAFEPPERVLGAMAGYYDTAAILGRRTAEMHLALAADTTKKAFAAEPLTRADLDLLTARATKQAQDAFQALMACRANLTEPAGSPTDQLLQSWDTLLARIRCAPPLDFVASKIRVHGDYHLGQVLWSEGDFYILDFEGEPARSLEERRLKQSPLKDVAGMIRSFGYAAYAGLFAFVASRRSELARLEAWARVWQLTVSAAFLRAYFELVAESLFVPPIEKHRDALLQLFLLEKALYELNYELNNRPEWARIPVRGILDLLNASR
jgi:maltose alpha-D-glucosyltransferase/alpha-amylase